MSQQINLYDPALLRKREWLTATNLAVVAGALLLLVGGWGAAVRMQLAKIEAESRELTPLVKGMQEELVALGKQIAAARPDPKLETELAASRERLQTRGDILAALEKGVGADSPGFAEYLRGFARQAPKGLWLTGFRIGDGGASMEISGRMTDPALLPEYINRLNNEKAFRGRAFAALKIAAGKSEAPVAGSADAPAAGTANSKGAAPAAAPFLEFTLIPAQGPAPAGAPLSQEAKDPRKLADIVPPEAARALEGKR